MKKVQITPFGTHQHQLVQLYTFETDKGYQLSVMDYGAAIVSYSTPDKEGTFCNITVAPSSFEGFVGMSPKWGMSIGPVAGRIRDAAFELQGVTYALEQNDHGHNLHSGTTGYDTELFQVVEVLDEHIVFRSHRKKHTGGFPGSLTSDITYTMHEEGSFSIHYRVQTDQETLVNPTNHTYFNLSGQETTPIDQTMIQLHASGFLTLTPEAIPTGEVDTTADFFQAMRAGASFEQIFATEHEQLQQFNGIDHPFILEEKEVAVTLVDPITKRRLTVQTDAPSIVIYTSNGFDDQTLLDGRRPTIHGGVALETQILPDAIHHSEFGNCVLKPGEVFESTTTYKADVVD